MLGAIAGDIIGSVHEFRGTKTKDFPLFGENATFTDDSVLTIALADLILRGGDDYAAAMKHYVRHYPEAGYGGMFIEWVSWEDADPYGSFGNGAAMRISPAGWAYATLDETLEHAADFTAVTHDHPEGIKGGQATAAAVYLARTGATKQEIRAYIGKTFGYDVDRTCDEVRPGYRFNETCQGTVPEAIIAFLDGADFEDAIRNAVSLGGDADTLGAITGAIAEAAWGVPDAIAEEALARLDAPLRNTTRTFMDRYVTPARQAP